MVGLRLAAAVATVAVGTIAGAATAAPIIDQQNTAPYYFNDAFGPSAYAKQVAQTFTKRDRPRSIDPVSVSASRYSAIALPRSTRVSAPKRATARRRSS